MRTHIVLRIAVSTFLAISVGTVATFGRDARAQSTLEVPGPAQQNQPYIPPRQAPPPYWNSPAGSDNPNGNTIQLLPPGLFNMRPAQPAAPPPPQARPNAAPNAAPNTAPLTSQAS